MTSGDKDAERGLVKGALPGALPGRTLVPVSWHLWFPGGRGDSVIRKVSTSLCYPQPLPALEIRALEGREL